MWQKGNKVRTMSGIGQLGSSRNHGMEEISHVAMGMQRKWWGRRAVMCVCAPGTLRNSSPLRNSWQCQRQSSGYGTLRERQAFLQIPPILFIENCVIQWQNRKNIQFDRHLSSISRISLLGQLMACYFLKWHKEVGLQGRRGKKETLLWAMGTRRSEDHVLVSWTLETCMILWTNVIPVNSITSK